MQPMQSSNQQQNSEVKDVFMTDAISLIGMIYECARVKNIQAVDF